MTALVLNRDRREFLTSMAAGNVYRSMGGCDMVQVRAGQNKRCERRVRELAGEGLAELGPDGRHYRLTADGVAFLGGGS